MRRLDGLMLGFFLLAVRAEKEDFQGYPTEKTKGTTVTKDLLLKKQNTIGHGTEAIPTENTHRHAVAAVTAKFPGAVLHTGPTQPHERIQITKASPIIASPSREDFVSRDGQISLTSMRANPPATRIESEIPNISNYEKIAFSSTQAASESVMNGTSEPDVHLSAEAAKAPPWQHTLLDNRNQRNTDSVTLTSADRRLGSPILSASRPRVIDNLAAQRNYSDDKRSQSKVISNLGRNVYLFSTLQSIFQSDTAEDSLERNTVANLCLTCLKERRVESPHDSSDSLGTDRLALDFSQRTPTLPGLHQQSAEDQEEISHLHITENPTFGERGSLVHNQTFPLTLNKTMDHSQSFLSNSQIKSFPSDTEAIEFHTQYPSDTSPATQKDTKRQLRHTEPSETLVSERPVATTTALYQSSKSLYTVKKPKKNEEQEVFGKKVSTRDPQSKPVYFSENNKNASRSLSTKFTDVLIQNQPFDRSSEPVSNVPVIAEASHGSQESVLAKGSDHSAASHPIAGMNLIQAHSAITPFRFSRPSTLAVKNPESHSLTRRADSLISELRSQTPTEPRSQNKEVMLTLLPKDSATAFSSGTTKRGSADKQDSQTFNTVRSIVKQPFVDPPGPVNKPFLKEPQTPTFTTRKVVPVKFFITESRQDFGKDVSALTLTTPSTKSLTEKLTITGFLRTQSKIIRGNTFDVMDDKHMAPTRQSFTKDNGQVIRESLTVPNLKTEDENERVSTVAVENEDKEILKTEGKQDENNQETKEILKLQEEDESRGDDTLKNKRGELFQLHKAESGNQGKMINAGAEITLNTSMGAEQMEEHNSKANGEEGGRSAEEKAEALRRDKDQIEEEGRDEGGAEREGVTTINTVNSTKVFAEKQIGSERGAEGRSEETSSEEDIKRDGDTGNQDKTNVPLETTTNSKELGRDKRHTVTSTSSCHSFIKQSAAAEHQGIRLGESSGKTVEITNEPFKTSNHRPPHSSLSTTLSKMPPLPEQPNTQITPHLSTHGAASSLTEESSRNKVVETARAVTATPKLFQSFGVSPPKFRPALKPTISPHSGATKSAHPALKRISNMLSLTTPRLPITAGVLRAQSHFTVNSSTLNISIIYRIPDHRHKFSTSASKASSVLHPTNEGEQVEYIIPSVNPAPHQQMHNDSSTRPPTAAALSAEAHISIGLLQLHQGQPAPQIPPSSSSDMASGKPCSFKLSERTTAHPDALHAPVDDNEHRSVQILMASMSPKADNNQFPLSSMSPLLNPGPFEGDSSPGTYSTTGLTRSSSEKGISRANSDAGYANSGSDHAEGLLGTADEPSVSEGSDSVRGTVTSKVKHSDAVTEKMAGKRDENSGPPFTSETTIRGKHQANSTDGFNAFSLMHTEERAAKKSNGNEQISEDGNDGANNTEATTLKNNHLSPLESATAIKTEQPTNEDFVHIRRDFETLALDTNNQTATAAFVDSDSLPEMFKIQSNDVTGYAIFDMKHHAATNTEKQNNPSPPPGSVSDNGLPAPHINFRSDLAADGKPTQFSDWILAASHFQIASTKTNDSVSLPPTANNGGLTASTEAHESPPTTTQSVPVATQESSRAARAEHMAQSNSHIEALSVREPAVTTTTGKLSPAVKRKNTREARSEPGYEISSQAIEQRQHAPSDMTAITRPINDREQVIQTGLLKTAHGAERAHHTTSSMLKRVEYAQFQDLGTALTTRRPAEGRHSQTSAAHTLNRLEQRAKITLPHKTSVRKVIYGAMTDYVPPTVILPTQINNKTSCGTTGCAKSGETAKTTKGAGAHTDKIYKTQNGNSRTDTKTHTKPESGSCSSDCPVPGIAPPPGTDLEDAALSPVTGKSDNDRASGDGTMSKKAKMMTDKAFHLEGHWTPEQARFVQKTTRGPFHKDASEAQEGVATGVTLSEPEATVQATVKTTKHTLDAEKGTKTQLNKGAGQDEIFEAQNASRSVRAVAKGEMAAPESGYSLLLPEPEDEQPRLEHGRRTSPHQYLSGVTEVSDDLCGSGNYTAEMILSMGGGVEPGDAVPALGTLRVVINLKTNNSLINLEVTSCCLSPHTQPDLTNSTCCLFSRLAAEPVGITLLPSSLSTSASFTISLFQMINYSVVYLHCDLSVCPRNHSDCERRCLHQRSAFSLEGPETIVANLGNRISFGPLLKQVKNSTFPEEIDPSELDLVLVVVSLVVGFSLVTVMLLLVWLAYRRRAVWPLHSASPPRACCGCLRPGADLILP